MHAVLGRSAAGAHVLRFRFRRVLDDGGGDASGSTSATSHFEARFCWRIPSTARIRRNGGCFLLYHQLRAAGARIVYESRACVSHGLDIRVSDS